MGQTSAAMEVLRVLAVFFIFGCVYGDILRNLEHNLKSPEDFEELESVWETIPGVQEKAIEPLETSYVKEEVETVNDEETKELKEYLEGRINEEFGNDEEPKRMENDDGIEHRHRHHHGRHHHRHHHHHRRHHWPTRRPHHHHRHHTTSTTQSPRVQCLNSYEQCYNDAEYERDYFKCMRKLVSCYQNSCEEKCHEKFAKCYRHSEYFLHCVKKWEKCYMAKDCIPPTPKPTTAKPTTLKPTTKKSTTLKPTTKKPTTAKPTTSKPTTAKPTTA